MALIWRPTNDGSYPLMWPNKYIGESASHPPFDLSPALNQRPKSDSTQRRALYLEDLQIDW
jgi:hypothetical protein